MRRRSETASHVEKLPLPRLFRKVQFEWEMSRQVMPAGRAGCSPGKAVAVEWRRDGALRIRWLDRYLKHQIAPAATGRGKAVDMPGHDEDSPSPLSEKIRKSVRFPARAPKPKPGDPWK